MRLYACSDMALFCLLLACVISSAMATSSESSRTSSRQLATVAAPQIEVDATYFMLQQSGAPPSPFVKIVDGANPSVTLQPYLPWRGSLYVVRLQERRPKFLERHARRIGGRMVDWMQVSRVRATMPEENRTWDGRILNRVADDVYPLGDIHSSGGMAFPLSGGPAIYTESDSNLAELLADGAANEHFMNEPTMRQWRLHSDALKQFAEHHRMDLGQSQQDVELHVTRMVFGFGARNHGRRQQSTVFGVPKDIEGAQLVAPHLRFTFYPATWGFHRKNPVTINTLPVRILPLSEAANTMLETLDYENMPKTLRQSLLGSFYAKMAEGNYDVPHIMRYGSTRDALPSAMILEQLIIIHGKLTMGLDCAALSTEWRIHAGEVLRTELGDDYEQMYVQAVEHSNEVLASQRIAFGKAIAELRQMIKNAPYSFKWSANNPVLKRAVRTLTCENIEG